MQIIKKYQSNCVCNIKTKYDKHQISLITLKSFSDDQFTFVLFEVLQQKGHNETSNLMPTLWHKHKFPCVTCNQKKGGRKVKLKRTGRPKSMSFFANSKRNETESTKPIPLCVINAVGHVVNLETKRYVFIFVRIAS